ncbi:MAG: hypothetical protein C0617_00230 [Desulfuromonas sp.]|uniref:SRPBCC family protein n=1 Tax=Desulfuromonas sp. TaxID=892 RepID=UPI000CABDBF6|nr:SRPBCC family protein [Desulfuromonas sp.]PLX86673.1 MAG: hypothetical protein C0617_00230 [Desulfuromonas sp.]
MAGIEITRDISAPATAVWALLTDTRQWPRWGPSVAEVRCSERNIRGGSRGAVRTPLGVWLTFTVTAFEPGRSWAWKVAGVPATGHRVEPQGRGRCRLVFIVPLWAAPYAAVCRLAAGRIARLAERAKR